MSASATPELSLKFRSLVDELYMPKQTPAQIQEINQRLQEFQRSDFAFSLADNLFGSENLNHKYFAALTVAQKSNTYLREADNQINASVIRMSLAWFLEAVDKDLPSFLLQRISSTIVAVFMSTSYPWQNCLKDVFVLLAYRDINLTLTPESVDLVHCINTVSDEQMSAVFTNFITLAEECRRMPHTAHNDEIHRRIASNFGAVLILLNAVYERLQSSETAKGLVPSFTQKVFVCHLQWMELYATAIPHGSAPDYYTNLLPFAMKVLEMLPNGALSSFVSSVFNAACDLIETAFKDERILITEPVSEAFLMLLKTRKATMYLNMDDGHGYGGEVVFNRMVLAYCRRSYRALFLPNSPGTQLLVNGPEHQHILADLGRKRNYVKELIQQLTYCLFHHVLEPDLSLDVIEFWDDFVQDTRDYYLRDEAQAFALEVIDAFCSASTLRVDTDLDDSNFYDETENEVREDVRSRCRDLLQVFCEEYGTPVFERLLKSAEGTWFRIGHLLDDRQAMMELETPLYFLIELAESLRFSSSEESLSEEEDRALGRLFTSAWFAAIFDEKASMPETIRKQALRAIGEFKSYFGLHETQLWFALDLLITRMRDNTLAAPAAVSLRNICDENRSVIAGAGRVEAMVSVCAQYFEFPGAQREAKAAIIAAVTSVAEAMEKPEVGLLFDLPQRDTCASTNRSQNASEVLNKLLQIITKDHDRRMTIAQGTGAEAFTLIHVVSRDTLTLLVAMGRASQSKEDHITLSSASFSRLQSLRRDFWTSPAAGDVQVAIATLLRSCLEATTFAPDTVALACDILKSGFRERLAGPFVFEPLVTIEFVTSMPVRLDLAHTLIKLIAEFVSSQTPPSGSPDNASLSTALGFIIETLTRITDQRSEPELNAVMLDAVDRTLRCSPSVLTTHNEEGIQTLLEFSLTCLRAPEPLPKRAATTLWQSILSTTGHPKLKEIIRYFGQALVNALVLNFCGAAQRSELNRLADLLRGLVKGYKEAKGWLEKAMLGEGGDAEGVKAVPEAERKRFVSSVVMVRGDMSGTRKTVGEFWGVCKGVPVGGG
ncbi:MAG: hypothetical protein Q9162_003724 [Coniocarpon cinnabarinum]